MKTGSYSPAQRLASLLPHHEDIKAVLESCGRDEEASSWIGAIRRLTADIAINPNDAELWFDLSRAFWLWDIIERKYLFVAHRIDPENTKYLDCLAWAYDRMGDHKQSVGLVNKAFVIADKDADRIWLIKRKYWFKNRLNVTVN